MFSTSINEYVNQGERLVLKISQKSNKKNREELISLHYDTRNPKGRMFLPFINYVPPFFICLKGGLLMMQKEKNFKYS